MRLDGGPNLGAHLRPSSADSAATVQRSTAHWSARQSRRRPPSPPSARPEVVAAPQAQQPVHWALEFAGLQVSGVWPCLSTTERLSVDYYSEVPIDPPCLCGAGQSRGLPSSGLLYNIDPRRPRLLGAIVAATHSNHEEAGVVDATRRGHAQYRSCPVRASGTIGQHLDADDGASRTTRLGLRDTIRHD